MKSLLTISFIFLFSVINGQVMTDGVNEDAVVDIIHNYHNYGVQNFSVHNKHRRHNGRKWKYELIYTFVNDSILIHKFQSTEQTYILKDGFFSFVSEHSELEENNAENVDLINFYEKKDSANTSTLYHFSVVNLDTTLLSTTTTVKDTFPEKIVVKTIQEAKTTDFISITEKTTYANDTIRTTIHKNNGDGLFLASSFLETMAIYHSKNSVVYEKTIKGKNVEWKSYPIKYYEFEDVIKKTIYFNSNGLITKIQIDNIYDNSKTIETEIIIPKILKK